MSDVGKIYTSSDISEAGGLLRKYNVSYVIFWVRLRRNDFQSGTFLEEHPEVFRKVLNMEMCGFSS